MIFTSSSSDYDLIQVKSLPPFYVPLETMQLLSETFLSAGLSFQNILHYRSVLFSRSTTKMEVFFKNWYDLDPIFMTQFKVKHY